ncbi:hypothetical protein OJF2_15220 [Aquisphaera giovannonii]|uniref:Uncharacterized protein n=2 Tax=Aquisphaera giovannonii TaxID=406548 RepID=A0A5B9VYF6_9BACT|nr:hypothetical protein OJF2_15220 [Aquisphaera giovannonii]
MLVLRHVRPDYARPSCVANLAVGERHPEPIEEGLPGPSLLAQVAVIQYAEHTPSYRHEGSFRGHTSSCLGRRPATGWPRRPTC